VILPHGDFAATPSGCARLAARAGPSQLQGRRIRGSAGGMLIQPRSALTALASLRPRGPILPYLRHSHYSSPPPRSCPCPVPTRNRSLAMISRQAVVVFGNRAPPSIHSPARLGTHSPAGIYDLANLIGPTDRHSDFAKLATRML
jgi:hypothetical protein